MPCYDVLVGAKMVEGNAHLAERIGTVPAKRIPDFLAEALIGVSIEKTQLKSLTANTVTSAKNHCRMITITTMVRLRRFHSLAEDQVSVGLVLWM